MSDVAAGPYQVELERFQGPLELLLHLIRRQDLDIFDIPIARVAAQFLEAVRGVRQLPLEHAGEFLEMAATLVRIKAQMLFPRRGDEEEGEDPRAELVRRLLEWEHFRDAAEGLAGAEADSARRFGKGYVAPRPPAPATAAPLLSEWSEVLRAARALAARMEAPEPEIRFTTRAIPVEEKIALVRDALRSAPRVEFAALVAPWGTRMHAVVSLLACLELARADALRLRQGAAFAPLWLLRAA